MKLVTEIGLTKPLSFIFLQNNNVTINVPAIIDYSGKAVRFGMKYSKDDVYEIINKQNLNDGGSDSQILVTSDNIAINILAVDTWSLLFSGNRGKYYWEVKNITDEQTIAWGYIFVIKTTLKDTGTGAEMDNFLRAGTLAERDAWRPPFGYGIWLCTEDNGTYYFINGAWK